jgi:hypothetical protein
MKLGTALLMLAIVTAPACGGGGGGSDPGGSPSPLAASFVPDQPSPGANTVAFAEGSKSNDVVTVNVTMTSTNGVFGAAFEVVYDDAHTTFLGYTPGSVVEQGGNSPTYNVDGAANPGRIVVGVSRTGSAATNVSGTKTVIGLQFRVKQAGVYPMVIQNAAVYDSQNPPQQIGGISWFAGAVSGL